jgi:glycosyltransferase involved in cell wall biosynthesis
MADKPKIAVIGPVLPFRGGIAQYTTMVHRSLQEVADVQTISFKRLYPGWLYPGEGNISIGSDDPREPGVDYLIDVYNPLTLRKATNKIIKQGADLVIIDWWTLFWWPGISYMARRLRKHGIKTMFLCHNLFNHKTGGLMGLADKVMYSASVAMLKQADAYLVQSNEQRAQLEEIKPGAEVVQRMHPIYTMFPAPKQPLPKRGKLELLFFGLIRPYKGLDILLDAAAKLQDKDLYITVVGEPWGDKDALVKQIEEARIPNLETHLKYVDDQEAADFMARADAVVQPYRSATGSGVVALAYHYNKPVIATKVGGLKEAVLDDKTGFLVEPNSPEALAEAIQNTSREELAAMGPAIEKFCAENSWEAMAKVLADFASNSTRQ